MKDKLAIIDGNNLLFRSYYALPLMTNFDGEFCNAIFGFANTIVKIVKEVQPKYMLVCFDAPEKNFRYDMYDAYKGTRGVTPEELKPQFALARQMLDAMGIHHIEGYGLEADDLIGCASRKFDTDNIVVTADKDCLQLITENTVVLQPKKGNTEGDWIDIAKLRDLYGISPKQIIDLKSLMGDSSDNIPGVKGIGEKTALDLLAKYNTLDGIYNNLDKLTPKQREKMIDGKESAYLSYKLATIITDRDIDVELNQLTYDYPFGESVLQMFKRYQFNSLLRKPEIFAEKTAVSSTPTAVNVKCTVVDNIEQLTDVVKQLSDCPKLAITFDTNMVSLYDQVMAYNIPIAINLIDGGLDYEQVLAQLKPLLEGNTPKIVFDSKALKHTLHDQGVQLNGVAFDIMLARYVINPIGKASASFSDVAFENNLADVNPSSYNLYCMYNIYSGKMDKAQQTKLYYDIELPLVDVLFDMEIQGFKLDRTELVAQQQKYEKLLQDYVSKIYEYAGKNFNINSPKQLSEVLFDELGLNTKFNKKKSTNAQVLEEIYDRHPIVPLILAYRQVSKLYNTYIVAYLQSINPSTGKIYTLFNQLNTTTGRLSSSEPNLQNIPVRTEEGRNIRKIFVPTHPDGYIVSADYSQIELRLLADFSGDAKLINAFNSGVDIHTLTASEIFGVDPHDVTPIMRRNAKAINFGIVYGISDYGLSQNISISVADANAYIKSYFDRYPSIKQYMDSNVEFCKSNGYVTTMFGRRRYIPEINSTQYQTRMFGERAAMNMPLQGSASDIIKLAMIKVHDELSKKKLRSKLILQVHDELIVDTVPDELQQVQDILRECMENVVDLKVKLNVNVSYGHNWYDAKD